MWSSGALSQAHHGLEKDCQACHVDAFVTVKDKSCLTCHEDDAQDHANPKRLLTARGGPEGFERIGAAFASVFKGLSESVQLSRRYSTNRRAAVSNVTPSMKAQVLCKRPRKSSAQIVMMDWTGV